jgi:hypothetical protein
MSFTPSINLSLTFIDEFFQKAITVKYKISGRNSCILIASLNNQVFTSVLWKK